MEEISGEMVAPINCEFEVNIRTCPVEEPEAAPVPRPRSFVQKNVGTFQRSFSVRVAPTTSSDLKPTAGSAPSFNQRILGIKDMLQVAQTELNAALSNQENEADSQIAQLKMMHNDLKEELNSMVETQNGETSHKLNQAMQKIVKVEMDVSALKKYIDQKINRRSRKLVENTNECLIMLASMVDEELEKMKIMRESEKEEIERNLERKMEDMVNRMVEQKISELRLQSEESNTLTPISSSEIVWSEDEDNLEIHQQTPEGNSEQQRSYLDSEEEESRKIEEEFRKRLEVQNQAFEHRFTSIREKRHQAKRHAEEHLTAWRRRFVRKSPDSCSLQDF